MAGILVTGGAGFIGSNFVHYWLQEHPDDEVVVLDALCYAGNLANLANAEANPRYTFVEGNIGDEALVEALLEEHGIRRLVNFAAESHVDRSISGPDPFISSNIDGTHRLLKAARNCWLGSKTQTPHLFHHISTDEVYGSLEPDEAAFTEHSRYAPSSPYAASKAAADHLVRAYQQTYGLQTSISNCTNNYGPYQHPEKFLPKVITHCLLGKPIPIYGDGQQIRDWLYVEDHCRAIDLILSTDRRGETWNIGANVQATNLVMARGICRSIDERFAKTPSLAQQFPEAPPARDGSCLELVDHVDDRPGHDRRYALDSRKIESELGFRARNSTHDGLQASIDWYIKHQSWWIQILRE